VGSSLLQAGFFTFICPALYMTQELYHGWWIELSDQPEGFSYQCWLPGHRLAVSDRKVYPSLASAQIAAHDRADLESVKWALRHCYASYVEGSLTMDEFETLESLIMDAIAP
jgi:hypothetical protein